jgi:hypothetical protein
MEGLRGYILLLRQEEQRLLNLIDDRFTYEQDRYHSSFELDPIRAAIQMGSEELQRLEALQRN